jgi:hypothetical protein
LGVKTIKVQETSIAGIQVGENSITAAVSSGKEVNGVLIDESGVYIRGKLSIMTSPSQIRVGGFWVQNSPWRQMLPSNIAFPNPTLVMNSPTQGIENMANAVQFMQGLLFV